MTRIISGLAGALVLATLSAANASTSSYLTDEMEARVAELKSNVIAWRRDFHEHPELGNRETRSAGIIADHLRSLGMDVTTGVAYTGVVGVLEGGRPGPVVALRADMDALPVTERTDVPFASRVTTTYDGETVGVSHACGHDTHMAILMGAAEVLAAHRDELGGTVKFIFQPAEEGPPEGEEGGAELMVKEGVLENPDVDAAFALHIDATREVGNLFYRSGGLYASVDDFRITVKGRSAHGAYPWMGVDPVVTAAQIVNALQTVVSRNVMLTDNAAVVTVGKIQGGVRSNIIPEEVELIGTIRALDPEAREHIHKRIRQLATSTAEGMGATVKVEIPMSTHYPVTANDAALTERMGPVLEAVAGKDHAHGMNAETGAEDFSFIARQVPGFYFVLGGRPADVPPEEAADHHTPDFYVDDSGLDLGVRAMVAVTLAYMDQHASGND